MTVEYALRSALQKVDSDKVKERAVGLGDLKTLLSDPRNVSQVDEYAWRNIFDVFTRHVEKRKAEYLHKKTNSSTSVLTRLHAALSEAGQDLRWLCEKGFENLKEALVKPILEHILSVLPCRYDALFEPLATSYTRTLRLLLSRQSYRDHLPTKAWEALLDLCTDGLLGFEECPDDSPDESPKSSSLRGTFSVKKPTDALELSRVFALLVISCPRDLLTYTRRLLDFLARYFAQNASETPSHGPLLAAANHVLFETAYNYPDTAYDFLCSVIPHLISLWESRSAYLKSQLIYILRFYIQAHAYSEDLDWRQCVTILYDVMRREMSSRFSVGPVSHTGIFVSLMTHCDSPTGMTDLIDEWSHKDIDVLSRSYGSLVYIETLADVFYHVLKIEAHPITERQRTASEESSGVRDSCIDSPIARKRARRSDVLGDISRTFASRSPTKDEKALLLQTLSILLTKYRSELGGDACQALIEHSQFVLDEPTTELHSWALLCLACLITTPQIDCKLVWDLALRSLTLSTTRDAAWALLSSVLSARVLPNDMHAAAQTEFWKMLELHACVDSHFMGICRVIQNLDDMSTVPILAIVERLMSSVQALSAVTVVDVLVVLTGTTKLRQTELNAIVRDAAPPFYSIKDDYVSEWRFTCMMRIWRGVVNKDFKQLLSVITDESSAGDKVTQNSRAASKTVSHSQLILALELGMKKFLQGETVKDVHTCCKLLAAICFMTTIIPQPDKIVTLSLCDMLNTLAKTLSALTVQTTSVKASDLEPLSEYFKAYNPTSELSINPGLMIPLLWPLSRPIYEELLDKTFQYLLRCVKTGFPAENDNRVKRGEDEFEVLSAASDHLKLGAALHIQTEFLGVPFGSNCPTQSAFTALTDLYMAATKVTGLEDIRAKLTKTLCNAITTPTIPFLPADAVRFLAALAPFAMTDQVDSILEHIAHLLSSYESERNFRCWVWILQCLAALASCLTRLCLGELTRNSIEETIKKRACDYLAFFSNTRVWRVKMSLGSAMLSLVFADPTLSFLSQCFSAEVAAAKDPAFQAIFNLLHHEELQVRLAFGQRIPCLFDLFAEEDHETILTDVLSALENANTKVEGHGEEEKEEIVTRKLTSAVAMTECSVRATWHRAGCISGVLALLSPTGDDADGLDLITQLLNMVAERLHIASGSEFLEAVLPAVIWAWDGPAATFPYQVLGYHGEAGFLQEWGAYWVARAWQPNKTLNKNELQSLGGLSRAWMEQVLAIMLPTCQPKNIRTGQYPPAIANVRELCGDRFVPEVKKRAPHIIGEIISRCYDPALASIPVEYAAVVKYWTAMRAQSDPGSSPTFGPPEILPRFDAKAIIAGLETLSLLLLPEDVDGAVSRLGELLSTDTLERAFRDLHLRLFKDPFASSRARLLTNGYGLLVALALSLDTISHPYLYAIVIKCLVRYIAYPESISICIGILVPLIDHGVMHEDLRATLSQMVVQLGDISQALLTTRPTHANFVLELVIRTLRTMQNINEESVRLTVLQLDSRLQVESRFNTEFRTRIVASDLSKLLKIGPGPGSIRFLREATELHRIPDELGQQIVNFIITTLKKIDEFDDKNRELIFDCVAILARLSTCLGLKFKDTTAPTNVINEKLRVQGVHSNDAENCHLGHAVALHHLTEQSNNDDEFVVDRAVTVLRAILGTTLGEKAFHLLSEKEPTLIDLFIPSISVSTIVAAANSGFLSAEHDDVWLPEEVGGHVQESAFDAWIVKITMSVLLHFPTNELFPILVPAVEDSPVLAETIFKYVVHCALLKEVAEAAISVGRRKSPTLRLRQTLSRQFKRVLQRAGALPSRFINAILKIVEFLRTQPVPAAADIFEANAWLDLDFLILARAAVITQSFATSLLFLEISREKQLRPWGLLAMSDDRNPNAEKETTDLLLNIYRNIGDQDGYDGVDALRKDVLWDDVERLVSRYEHDGAWEKVLNIRETQLKALPGSKEDTVIHTDFIKSLSKLSYYHLLDICVTGAGDAAGTKDVKEAHYEALWRCQRWDDGEQHKAALSKGENAHLYGILKCVSQGNAEEFGLRMTAALQFSVNTLKSTNLRGMLDPFTTVRPLVILNDIHELFNICKSPAAESTETLTQMWAHNMRLLRDQRRFDELEPILASRTTAMQILFNHTSQKNVKSLVGTMLTKQLLQYAQMARKAGSLHTAGSCVAQLNACLQSLREPDAASVVRLRTKVEAVKSLWAQGDHRIATRALQEMLTMSNTSIPFALRASIEYKLGNWVGESRAKRAEVLLTEYYEPAVMHAATCNDSGLQAKAHYHLAKFADAQYQTLAVNDPCEHIREHIRYKLKEAAACDAIIKENKADKAIGERYRLQKRKIEMHIQEDQQEEQEYIRRREGLLLCSVENYLQSLQHGNAHPDVCVFRLCTLWFANLDLTAVNKVVASYVDTLPTWKFLTLMYQLSARLSSKPDAKEANFQTVLQRLIIKLAQDHPFHTLYQIIALKNGNVTSASSVTKAKTMEASSSDTALAAQDILNKLRSHHRLKPSVEGLDLLSNAYIQFAYKKISQQQMASRDFKLDPKSALFQIAQQGLDVPIASAIHPIMENCDYSGLPRIARISTRFACPGGINVPKVLDCRGTDGKIYRQLVKGNDDLRQDAVLSSVFNSMNGLLRKSVETRKRNLSIRTYKVVPLAPRAGLVEWVQDTLPIGAFLLQAHPRYYKKDWLAKECRTRLQEAGEHGHEFNRKLKVYKEIEAHFHPVFRHFFFEKFHDPVEWFETRLAYSRSVAASSIAGFIVGLGDRHAQNILIDQNTAEVVHIDLGIAFDQGKHLNMPEIVPFRLTRDIVDGMGITKTEGTFRRCCEETLKVLRSDAEVILTILEVFRYDPLYNWKVTPMEQRRRQGLLDDHEMHLMTDAGGGAGDNGGNKEAENALRVVRQKLSPDVSVECQVNELIHTAMDANNLSKMFPGWQPWL